MTPTAPATIDKVDYTTTPHPSGVKALSLKDAPALIESLLPVQKLSADVYKERTAGPGQTLTALGSYWKGRKPLVLNRACVLASLLPATDNPIKDLEIFELLMGMDAVSLSKRLGLPKPEAIVRKAHIPDMRAFFVVEPADCALPISTPFNVENYAYTRDGVEKVPKLKWRSDISETKKHEIAALTFEFEAYRDLVSSAKRAEEVASEVASHIWSNVNAHLGTNAHSFAELVEQLGVMRFGHRPTVADTFSGSGQIPFAAAQLGCDVYASDLNPVACALTWGALNIVGAPQEARESFTLNKQTLLEKVSQKMEELGVESDGNGWHGKVYLYCLEVVCPSSGWRVPLLPSRIISTSKKVIAKLHPDKDAKRYAIEITEASNAQELRDAKKGTLSDGVVEHVVDGVLHQNSLASIRGDYQTQEDGRRVTRNRLRLWEKNDISFRADDIFAERLYAIQWIKELPKGSTGRAPLAFRTVTSADLAREANVTRYVQEKLSEWQEKGWVPDTRIEPGDETERLYRERGWTHWHHLFNPRQLLLAALLNASSPASLKFGLTRVLNQSCRLSRWDNALGSDKVQGVFDNQALNTLYNFGCRSSKHALDLVEAKLKSFPLPEHTYRVIGNHPAPELEVPADVFVTDPPYGDAVKYEEILEFFIAWLRKNPPTEFSGWRWDSRRELAIKGEDHDFRLGMVAAYKRMAECMPDNGLQILMFTHQDGNIWADMANIVWASGLRVTAAWYLVTETDSALREGSYVKGTILLVLRKRLGAKRTNQTDLAYELEEEVAEQIKRLTGMNDTVTADSKRAKDGNLFEDADLQMAGYAAALKVLTKYSVIDGKEMAQEALRPRLAGQKTLVESLIEFATDTANKLLVPLGLDEWVWHDLEPAERFYLKMLEQESHGVHKLDNYQNFAKAFAVRNFSALMASENANKAALKSAKEFGRSEMNQSSELFQTPTRAVLYALMDLQAGKDLDVVLKGLEQNVKSGAFYALRPMLVALSRYIARKAGGMRPEEASAARVLADGIDNQRL